ncbi:MAG: MFS transporter [Janthinobacterium lividum]
MSLPAPDRGVLGHPRGLAVLAATEGWIGFSFYGTQSLLVLFMTARLLQPGHAERVLGLPALRAALGHPAPAALAAAIMGLYGALAYATPILGGLAADRLLGRTRAVALGAVLMTAGHLLMAFEPCFLVALCCLVCGMGLAGTLKAQVGALYARDDPRRAAAFQLYSIAIGIAVILAPLACGTLGEAVDWRWGFLAAGTGMLLGLATYAAGRRLLPPEPPRRPLGTRAPRLAPADRRAMAALAALLPVLAVASVGNMEIFNAYLVWGRDSYALTFAGHAMPVSWLLSLDALVGVGALAGSLAFWRWWARRRRMPHELTRMAAGAAIAAAAPLVLAAASHHVAGGGRVGLGWGLAFHVVNDVGFANLYPVGMALYSRAAPPALGATVVNAYALHLFLSNLLVGWLAGLLGTMPAERFWLLHAALVGAAALVLLLCAPLFRPILDAQAAAAGPAPGPAPLPAR